MFIKTTSKIYWVGSSGYTLRFAGLTPSMYVSIIKVIDVDFIPNISFQLHADIVSPGPTPPVMGVPLPTVPAPGQLTPSRPCLPPLPMMPETPTQGSDRYVHDILHSTYYTYARFLTKVTK